MAALTTEVLIIGSGAGGAVTAAALAAAGRSVTVVEEGPWVDADSVEPFSLDEMVAKYRHHGLAAALGNPAVAYAEGRCVGGSTEINSGLYHRLPDDLADEWRSRYAIDEFTPAALAGYADRVESQLSVTTVPGAPPASSAVLERGRHEARLAQRRVRPGVQLRPRRPRHQADDVAHPAAPGGGGRGDDPARHPGRQAGPAGRHDRGRPVPAHPRRTAASSA